MDGKLLRPWLLTLGILFLLGTALACNLYFLKDSIQTSEQNRLLVQARVINENLNRQLLATYHSLKRVLSIQPSWRAGRSYRPAFNELLSTLENAIPGIRTVLIIDAKGIVRAANRTELIGRDLYQRDYFQTVLHYPDRATMYLSPPFTTVLNVYAMNATLMVPGPDGSFDGIVVATLDPEYVKTLLASVQYAPDMHVALTHGDGRQFIMVPEEAGRSVNDQNLPDSFFNRHRSSGKKESIMSGRDGADGEDHISALRTIDPAESHLDKPLIVSVSRDPRAVFAEFRREAIITGGLFLGISLLTLFFLGWQQANARQTTEQASKANAALEKSDEQYRLLAENTSDVFWQLDLRTNRFTYVSPSVLQLRGYTPEEVMAQPVESSLTPESLHNVRNWIGQSIREFEAGRSDPQQHMKEVEQPRKDGTTVWTEVSTTYLLDAEHHPIAVTGVSRDITERRRMEAVLRESEERFRSLFEKVHVIALVLDPTDGSIIDANTAATVFYGWSRDQLLAMKISDINTLSREDIQKEMEAARNEQRTYFQFRHHRADGSVRVVEVYSGPIVVSGRTLLYSIVHDISERIKAENRLADATAYVQTILSESPVCLAAYRETGEAISANEAAAKLVGTTTAILKQQNFRDLESWRRSGLLDAADRALTTGITQKLDVDMTTTYGRKVSLSCHLAPFQFDGKRHILLASVDITARREQERTIQQLANEQQVILNTIAIGIAYVKERKVVWTNPAFNTIFGYCQIDAVGLDASRLYANMQDYERVGREGYALIAAGGIYSTEVLSQKKDGSAFWLSLTGRAIMPQNPGEGSIWMLQDITERKRAEDALHEKTMQLEDLTRNLEQRVEEEVSLRKKNEDLLIQQSKLAAMGEMLGAIAHQWRQPLNALGLIVQNLREAHSSGELNTEYLDQTVQRSMAQIQHMSTTIDDFRTFLRPDKEMTVFDAMQAIGDVLSLFSAQLAASDIDFQLTCHTHGKTFAKVIDIVPCPEKSIKGFRNEFEHVMMNIINNAREAIIERRQSGSMDRSERGLITFEFRNADGKILIEVGDNGGGIPVEAIGRIFEPYFTTKNPAKGTGLGLYMSTVIVENHMQGRLTAKNSEHGAVLTIELPQEQKS